MGVNVIEIGNSYLDNVSPRDVSYCGIIVIDLIMFIHVISKILKNIYKF